MCRGLGRKVCPSIYMGSLSQPGASPFPVHTIHKVCRGAPTAPVTFVKRRKIPFPTYLLGLPGGTSGKEPACPCRRHKRPRFDPRVGKIPWREKRQPTPVFWPGEFHGQRNVAGYHTWGCKESNMTEVTWHTRE